MALIFEDIPDELILEDIPGVAEDEITPEMIDLAYAEYRMAVAKGVPKEEPISAWTREAFEQYKQYEEWIPLVKKERSHFEKLSESWRRGKENIDISSGYYDAKLFGDSEKADNLFKQYKLYQAREQLDPIESTNLLTKAEYGAARLLPIVPTTAKEALPEAITGAAIGAAVGAPAASGTLGTSSLAGAAIGWSTGLGFGSKLYMYRLGTGTMLLNLKDKGLESPLSSGIAALAGIPYAALEYAQWSKLTPGIRQGANKIITNSMTKILLNAGKIYGTTLGTNVLEEVGQDGIEIITEDLANYFEGNGINFSKQDFKLKALRLLNTAKESAISMSLLPIPGAAVDIVNGTASFESQNKTLDTLTQAVQKEGLTEEQANFAVNRAFERTIRELSGQEKLTEEQVNTTLRNHLADVTAGFQAQNTLEEEATIGSYVGAEGALGQIDEYGKISEGQFELNEKQKEINETNVQTTINKIQNLVAEAPTKIKETEALRRAELRERFGEAENILTSGKELELLYRSKKALQGELPVAEFNPIRQDFSQEELENLVWSIRTNDNLSYTEKLNTEDALMGRLLNREGIRLVRPFELKLFEKAFGTEFVKTLTRKKGLVNVDYVDQALQILNVPRTLLASIDISHPLRQGLLLAFRHPLIWSKHVGMGYRLFFGKNSEELAKIYDQRIKTSKWYDTMEAAGLEIVPFETKSASALERSDEFMGGHYAENIPGLGKGIRRSERAFVGPANYLRASVFSYYADQWERSGYVASEQDYKDLALFLNLATLRAPLKKLQKLGPILNAGLFSPRAALSRIRLPYEVIRSLNPVSKESWVIRKAVWGNVVAATAGLIGILSLAARIPGVKVEKDPKSSDFGKARYQNTRVDLTAGYGPLIRLIAQLMSGELKATDTDALHKINYMETILGYLRSQLNPAAGIAVDAATNTTFDGEKFIDEPIDIAKRLKENFIPFALQDIMDAIYYQGLTTGMVTAPLAFMGAGVQTYPLSPSKKTTMLKDALARETFGHRWEEVGPVAQKILRSINPQIDLEEQRTRYQQNNPNYLKRTARELDKSVKRLTKSLPKDVRRELDNLQIKLPGLGRRIGDNWFLNDKRYDEYHILVSMYMNRVLPKVVRSKEWTTAPEMIKRELITQIMDRLKNIARTQLTTKATRSDILSLQEYSRE